MLELGSRWKKIFFAIFVLQIPLTLFLFMQTNVLQRKVKSLKPPLKRLEQISSHAEESLNSYLTHQILPHSIKNLPRAEEFGIVLSVCPVDIPFIDAPYNASLIEEDDHYLLFFRHDTRINDRNRVPFHTHIGCIELDRFFHPTMPRSIDIDTGSLYSEDARVFKSKGEYYLIYNDLVPGDRKYRSLRIAKLDTQRKKVQYITSLDRRMNKIEKNWMPFEYGDQGIHLIYSILPHQVLHLPQPAEGTVSLATQPDLESSLSQHLWASIWGTLRGGTPPRLVDGEYLSFFHSGFKDDRGIVWYVMGAYTFEAKAPFKITSISPHPILFKGAYETPLLNTANPKVRCLYPVSFVPEIRDGKEVLQLSCGENDSGVKILTLDKEALLKSLKRI